MIASDRRRVVVFAVFPLFGVLALGGLASCGQPLDGVADPPPPARILPAQGRQELAGRFSVLHDPAGALTIADVTRPGVNAAWRLSRATQVSFGYTPDTYWVQMVLENASSETVVRILEMPGTIDSLDLFSRSAGADGPFQNERTGKKVPFSQRNIKSGELGFRLTLAPGEVRRVILRLASADSIFVHPVIWTEARFVGQRTRADLISAVYFGALSAMALFNLFIWLSLRDPAYLYYSLFQTAVMLMLGALERSTFQYFWPESPEWAARSEIFFAGPSIFAGIGFARAFLGTSYLGGTTSRIMRVLMTVAPLMSALALFTDHSRLQQTASVLTVATCALLLTAGVGATRRGSPNGRIFVLAWLTLLGAGIAAASTANGLISWHAFLVDVPRVGSSVEAILLSFGLARRIKGALREKEQAQRELVETQQARLAALGHLVAGVAHEIGNPLNFVIGGADQVARRLDVMKRSLDAEPAAPAAALPLAEASRAVALVKNGSERIRQTIETLRSYTRVRDEAPQPVEVLATLEASLALIEPTAQRQNIQLIRQLDEAPPTLIPSWPGELGQVFLNLLLNSCQAMPDGGAITVRARAGQGEAESGGIEITISDTGPGIPRENRSAIFDPFFTTRLGEGTGLGLSLSLRIVESHGGKLRLLDTDHGATFAIWLPRTGTTQPHAPLIPTWDQLR